MKLVSKMLLFGIVFALGIVIGGHTATRHIARPNGGNNTASVVQPKEFFQHKQYRCIKTISYYWDVETNDAAHVEFESIGRNEWQMFVRSPSNIYDKPTDTVWGPEWSSCSKEECLRMIDRSLSDFRTIYPHARLDLVKIQMHVIRELWVELLAGMRRTESTLEGTWSQGSDIPPEINAVIQQVLDKSSTTRAIWALLVKHGMKVQHVSSDRTFTFKESLVGQKWSHIATLRDAGAYWPAFFGFGADP